MRELTMKKRVVLGLVGLLFCLGVLFVSWYGRAADAAGR